MQVHDAQSPNTFSLYLHLPFCDHICGYCDFYTVYRQPNHPILARFTDAIVKEIELRSETEWGEGQVETIYLGGGTPSLLHSSQISRILQTIGSSLGSGNVRETTIEINPCLIDQNSLEAYIESGITRPSFGIQSFHDTVLKQADRIHTSKQAIQAVELAQKVGFTNINVDMLYGIPGQEESHWKSSLKQLAELHVRHVSLYNLTYEEGTPFYHRRATGALTPVEEELEEWFYQYAVDFMHKNDFGRYEISNFAMPGYEGQHNLNYWNMKPYLGIGPSAHSFDGQRRYWNGRNLKKYLNALEEGRLPPMEQEWLNESMHLEEWVFLNLRQSAGMKIERLRDRFCVEIRDWEAGLDYNFGQNWRKWLLFDGESIALTRDGFWVSNSLFPIFCTWFQDVMNLQRAKSPGP